MLKNAVMAVRFTADVRKMLGLSDAMPLPPIQIIKEGHSSPQWGSQQWHILQRLLR
jgi:hypothetical protein